MVGVMWWRRKQRHTAITLRQYLALAGMLTEESQRRLQGAAYHGHIGRHQTPANLDEATLGDVIEGGDQLSKAESVLQGVQRLSGLTEEQLMDAPAQDVLAFIGMCAEQLRRIERLFAACKVEPTKEERQAGMADLDHGVFGLVDWYAQRMGISDHDQVFERVKWVYVYNALKIDTDNQRFQRRLQEIIYNNNTNTKKK